MLEPNEQPAELYVSIVRALHTPLTARAVTAAIYGTTWTGRDLWRVMGAIDRLVAHGEIVRCGTDEGRPVYVA